MGGICKGYECNIMDYNGMQIEYGCSMDGLSMEYGRNMNGI